MQKQPRKLYPEDSDDSEGEDVTSKQPNPCYKEKEKVNYTKMSFYMHGSKT